MYLLGEAPAESDSLINQLQKMPAQLTQGLVASGPVIHADATENLNSQLANDQVYLVQSGLLHVCVEGQPLMYLQEGDLLGLSPASSASAFRYSTDEAIELLPFDRDALLRHIGSDTTRQLLYTQYLVGQSELLSRALARSRPQSTFGPSTNLKRFAAGEELIRQGDEAQDVFVIVEGHAEAFVNGQKVGDVHKDEIFGAMAIFTREKRSAAVVASEACTVMVIPKDQFLSLMHGNPQIAHSLIESMARRIDLMNKEITKMHMPLAS